MKVYSDHDRLTDSDIAILKAIVTFGPVSRACLRKAVGVPCSPQRSVSRLQKCGYLAPKSKGTVGNVVTDSGRRYFTF